MPDDGQHFKPPVLTKDWVAYRASIQVGDPWTFLKATLGNWDEVVATGVGGFISAWWDTSENGRLFRVVRVHDASVETTYHGFQQVRTKHGHDAGSL